MVTVADRGIGKAVALTLVRLGKGENWGQKENCWKVRSPLLPVAAWG